LRVISWGSTRHRAWVLDVTAHAAHHGNDDNPAVMGERVNGRAIIILGWIATTTIFVASLDLIASYFVDGPVIDSRKIHNSNREKWHSTFK